MRFSFIFLGLLLLAGTPVFAEDMFTYFERGTWGRSRSKDTACETNPAKISFTADHKRAVFTMPNPATDYQGQAHKSYGYDILSFDDDGIVMRLDDEQRLTPDGKTVIWVLKPLPDHMFCWGRTDWPSTGCIVIHVRCPELPPIS